MPRRSRLLALVGASGLLLAAALALYRAWRHVPDFYRQALMADPASQRAASDQLLARASALGSDACRQGTWQGLFNAAEINGWLAVDLPRNHPGLMPRELHEPRVAIERDHVRVAARWGSGRLAAVFSINLGVQMAGPSTLAIRVERVRAGLMPLPLGQILDTISRQAARVGAAVRWRTTDGDPVAIVRLPPFQHNDALLVVRSVELTNKELFVSGTTKPARDVPLAEHDHEPGTPALGERPRPTLGRQ
jgi:hypothetical protein